MESQNPKVAMYVKRSFGEKLNASFDFIKENWKPLLKYTTYLMLPLCLVQAISLNGLMGGMLSLSQQTESGEVPSNILDFGITFFIYYALTILLYIIGSVLLTSLVYALIRRYNESEERLQGVTLEALKPLLFYNIKRLLLMVSICVLLSFILVLLMGGIAFLAPFALLLIVPLAVAVAVPLTLLAPIYVFEKISIMEALKKTFRLGFATWGGIFAVSFVMGLISSVLQGITMTPWYIATLVKYFFAVSDTGDAITISAGYNFLLYILAIFQVFGVYLSTVLSLIGLAYQYGHASEMLDSVMVESDIDNFDKL